MWVHICVLEKAHFIRVIVDSKGALLKLIFVFYKAWHSWIIIVRDDNIFHHEIFILLVYPKDDENFVKYILYLNYFSSIIYINIWNVRQTIGCYCSRANDAWTPPRNPIDYSNSCRKHPLRTIDSLCFGTCHADYRHARMIVNTHLIIDYPTNLLYILLFLFKFIIIVDLVVTVVEKT